jgi:thiamine-phosphate pyrophosphorylase
MIQIITPSTYLPGETMYWQQLLDEGADSILVRKPGWPETDYEQLLLEANPSCYGKLMISGHPALCKSYGLQGVHFGEAARSLVTPAQLTAYRHNGWRLSTSIHAAATLEIVSRCWDQLLLAPVFDSISKPGHHSAFEAGFRLSKNGYPGQVLALGGIDHNTIAMARNMQFDGIALLGAIWQEPAAAISNFRRIRNIWNTDAHTS